MYLKVPCNGTLLARSHRVYYDFFDVIYTLLNLFIDRPNILTL